MESAEHSPADGSGKRETDLEQGSRAYKRKKTVTWADDDFEGLLPPAEAGTEASAGAAAPAGGSPAAAAAGGSASTLVAEQQQQQDPVLVLPCDGLFDALSLDLLQQQVETPQPSAAGETLSRRQLLERRLSRTEQLQALYASEMWALFEELRLRHAQFAAKPGQSVWKHGGSSGEASGAETAAKQQSGTTAAEEQGEEQAKEQAARKKPKQKQKKEQQQQQQPLKKAETAAAAGAVAAEPSAEDGGEGAAAGGDAAAPGSALRALWQRQRQSVEQQAEPGSKKGKQQAAGAGKKDGKGRRQEPKQQAEAPKVREKERGSVAAPPPQQQQPQQQQSPKVTMQAATVPVSPPVLPCFEEVEQLILSSPAGHQLPPVDEAALLAARRRFVQRLELLGRLELGATASTCRELDAMGGLALLCGRQQRYVLRRAAVALGRCTTSQGKVDVDLSGEGGAEEGGTSSDAGGSAVDGDKGSCGGKGGVQRVSRQQAQLFLDPAEGCWRLRCTGRRGMLVNGVPLARGQTARLPSLSHISVGGVSLLFVANSAATARALGRSGALLAA